MCNSEAYTEILHYINSQEVPITDSPLFQQTVSFDRNIINIDYYFQKYDFFLSPDDEFAFNHINLLEITENELYLLKNLYNSKTNVQKLIIVLFILLIVLKQNSFYDIFNSDGLHYNMIFNPLFLPPNPKEKCSISLIKFINDFLSLEYFNHPTDVIQAIYSYVTKIGNDDTIYNFLPFFIQLLQKADQKFIQIFIDSDLFNKIMKISEKELPLFDFYRHVLFQYPIVAFQKVIITQNMLEIFFDFDRNQSIIIIFSKAIEQLTDYPEILKEILIVFSFIILRANEKSKEESNLIFGMLSCIDNFFNIIPTEINLSLFFKAVGKFAINSENKDSFELMIDLVRKLIVQRPSFNFQLTNQHNFFNTLSKYKKKIDYKYLINFAKLTPDGMIHLYQAISVLLSLIENIPEDEENVASELQVLCQKSGNLIELDRAKVPEFILKRLPIVQDKEEICEKYLNIYSIITSKVFHKTTFLHTIELIKNPEFKLSCDILSILNVHLDDFVKNNDVEKNSYSSLKYRHDQLSLHNEPFSFYRFDNETGCGITCPKIELSTQFTLCFWIRINEIQPDEIKPLILFDNEKNRLSLYYQNNKIYVNAPNETIELDGYQEFEQGKWYFLCFNFDRNKTNIYKYSLIMNISDENNSNQTSNKVKISFYSSEYKLYICRTPISKQDESLDDPSLICDMSAFILINEHIEYSIIRQRMIDYLTSSDWNINNFPHLLCLFNPSQSQDNACFNVNKNTLQIPYSGRTIPIIPNFYDVIQNITAMQTFMPLINLLSNKMDNEENGKKKLHLILSIFCNVISISENSFRKSRFFELLVSFLYHCESLIDKESFKDLLTMFLKIKNPELKRSILTSIYLNYKFLSKLNEKVQSLFFSSSPLQLYQTRESDSKIVFDDLSLIIYSGVKNFKEENENSKFYWNFIKRLSIDSPNDKNINLLIDFLKSDKNIKSEFVSLRIIDILISIFELKMNVDESYNDFTPYIFTYSQYHESIELLKSTIELIKVISKKTKINNEIYPTIYHLMIVFKPSLNMNINQLIEFVLKIILEEEMISFTSLLSILLKYSDNKDFNKFICNQFVDSNYIQNNLTSIPFWSYWLTKLFLQAYDPSPNKETKEFADLCIKCLKGSNKIYDLLDFFSIYNSLLDPKNENQKIDFNNVEEEILIEMINGHKKVDFSYVYHFMIFSIKTVKKEGNFPLSYFGDFVPELFSNFDINVTLKSTVNQTLLDLVISKTQSLLTKIVPNKVQLCGNKIEVTAREINSYLATLNSQQQNEDEIQQMLNNNENEDEKFKSISKNVLLCCLNHYKNIVEDSLKNNFSWSEDLHNTLRFQRQYTESDDKPIEYKLLFVFDPKKFDYYYNLHKDFISEQDSKYKLENSFLKKMKNSFMNSISLFPGPWEDPDKNKKIKRFKMLNRVSKSGKKILMRINTKFNDHKDASKNRAQNTMINNFDIFVYKILEKPPEQLKKNFFKAKIVTFSQSKEEEGLLVATEDYISISLESSNQFIYWDEIEFILNRRIGHIENSIEIFTNKGRSYFIQFIECERKYFYSFIDKLKLNHEELKQIWPKFDFFSSLRLSCGCIYQTKKVQTIIEELDLFNLWKSRKITTFSYLYYLNILSGRSYNCLNQYIIYPFIVSDVDSDEISIENDQHFRRLNIPIPALSANATSFAVNKYNDISEISPYLFPEVPSSCLAISWYLIRIEPFTTIHVSKDQQCGQFQKFDNPDRLFYSIKNLIELTYDSGQSKEFIPEFFDFPFFFLNENDFDLGIRFDHEKVHNIELPNWSRNFHSFVSTLRLMLEGKVSDKLISKWVDLLFGIKRRTFEFEGVKYNTYKPYLYPEQSNPIFAEEVIQCGSMPEQLFTEETGIRNKEEKNEFLKEILCQNFDKKNQAKFVKNILVIPGDSKAYELRKLTKDNTTTTTNNNNNNKDNNNINNNLVQLNLKNICGQVLCFSKSLRIAIYGTKRDPFLTFVNLNTNQSRIECQVPFIITAVYLAGGRFLVTGGMDCSIRVWDICTAQNTKVQQISSSGFHTEMINAVSCCVDNGLIVSCDMKSNLVFETLTDHVFINSVKILDIERKLESIELNTNDNESSSSISLFDDDIEFTNLFSPIVRLNDFIEEVAKFKEIREKMKMNKKKDEDEEDDNLDEFIAPQICVFKSGIVAVSSKSNLYIFDQRGKLACVKALETEIIEMHKCYNSYTREFLIVGALPDKIYVMDVAFLDFVAVYSTYFSSITTVQKSCIFVTYYKGKIKSFNFSDCDIPIVSKTPMEILYRNTYNTNNC